MVKAEDDNVFVKIKHWFSSVLEYIGGLVNKIIMGKVRDKIFVLSFLVLLICMCENKIFAVSC